MRILILTLSSFIFTSLGCATDRADTANASVRDSAGVRLIEYTAIPVLDPLPALAPQPIYRHGDDPGEYLFQRIAVGALQPDGTALVSDSRNQEVIRLGADGSSYSVLARSGQGPAEVRRVASLLVLGQDTVLIEDDGNSRFTLFENGSVARTISLGGNRDLVRGLRSYGLAQGGYVLMGTSSHRSGFPDPWLQGYLVRLDLDGLSVDTVVAYDRVPFENREGPRFPFMPFGHATAVGGRFVTARSDVAEVSWFGPDGALVQVVRWRPELDYPTEADFGRFRSFLRADLRRVNPQIGGTELEQFVNEQVSQYELDPDRPFPLFGGIRGDDEGRIWLETYNAWNIRTAPLGFTVLGAEGEWLGHVETPVSFRLLDIAGGRVLGVETDSLDIEQVVVYHLRTH